MTKLPLFALIALTFAGACKNKEAPKKQPPSPEPTAPVSDGKWLQRLPRTESAVKVFLDTTAGVVELKADGTVRIAQTPPAGTTDPLAKAVPSAGSAVASGLGLPPVAKRQAPALEAEGSAGSDAVNPIDELFAGLAHPVPATGAPDAPPARLTSAFAIAHPNDVSAGVVVFADPAAPAAALVEILAQTGGFVGVRTDEGFGALPLAFDRQEPPPAAPYKPWLELQAGNASQLAATLGGGSPDAAPDRLRELVQSRGTKALDVLVGPTTTVGDLIATLQLATASGIEAVGLGRALDASDPSAAKRASAGPRVMAWDFFMQGMDKTDPAPFRAALDAVLPPMLDCYKQTLAKKPAASGAIRVELIVAPDGKVGEVATPASPVAKELSACATAAIKKATFPAIATPTKMGVQLAFVTAMIAGSPAPAPAGAGSAGSGSAK